MMGYGWGFMGLFMWVVPLVILGLLVYFVVLALRQKGHGPSWGEAPLDILKKRYARGEITKEQFVQMKEDLKD